MSNFEALQRKNFRRSLLLVAALFVVLSVLVYAVGMALGGASSGVLAAVAVVFSAGSSALSWWQSDRLVLAMTRAKLVSVEEAPQLHNVVEEVAIASGLPKPRVALVDDPAPNAFATGRTPERAVVAVTTGLLERMDRDELQAVVAHEMAHVANRDTLMMSVAAATAGVIALIGDFALRLLRGSSRSSRNRKGGGGLLFLLPIAVLAPFAAALLKAALSRSREGLADATAVEFTRNPAALRSALGKLAADSTVVRARSSSVAHLWIECPLDLTSPLNRLYSTHPPIAERIAALWRLEGGTGAPPPIPGWAPDLHATEPVRGFGFLVASGALLLLGFSSGSYDGVYAQIGMLCMFASPVFAFAAYRSLGRTAAGSRWRSLAMLALLISGLIAAQNFGPFGLLAVGAMFFVLLAGRRRSSTGSGASQQVSGDVPSSAVHALDTRSAANSPTSAPQGVDSPASDLPRRTELAWNFRRIEARPEPADTLEAVAAAASAKWVKWVIGIFAATVILPSGLINVVAYLDERDSAPSQDANFWPPGVLPWLISLAILVPLIVAVVAFVKFVRRTLKSRRARNSLPAPSADTRVPD